MNWLPVNLMAKQIAVNSTVRLNSMGSWRDSTYEHISVLKMIADVPDNIDFWEPTPCLTDFTSITHREDMIIVFTDGYKSKEEIFSYLNMERKFPSRITVVYTKLLEEQSDGYYQG